MSDENNDEKKKDIFEPSISFSSTVGYDLSVNDMVPIV